MLRDGDVDEGLDGVVFDGRLCGNGARWGEGGSGCGGWGVLAWFWIRVLVRAGSLVLPSYLLWYFRVVVVVVVLVLLRVVLSSGFRFWFGVGFWVGVRFEVEEDLVTEA